MSRTGAITIHTDNLNYAVYQHVLHDLMGNGWTYCKDENIFFMINGSFDFNAGINKDFKTILNLIKESIDSNLAASIDLVWKDTYSSIGLMFLNEKTLIITISENIKFIDSLPIMDFSWYIEKISIIFKTINFFRIECNYD